MATQTNNEIKGGMTKAAALALAVSKVARKAANHWGSAARSVGAMDDAYSGALEGICLAWEAWNGEGGEAMWLVAARRYAQEYAVREVNKARSVVSTNYSRKDKRRKETDDRMVYVNDDGEEVERAFTDDAATPEDTCAAREELAALYTRLNEVAESLSPVAKTVAPDLIKRLMSGDDGETLLTIATRHGVSRQTLMRVDADLREALR